VGNFHTVEMKTKNAYKIYNEYKKIFEDNGCKVITTEEEFVYEVIDKKIASSSFVFTLQCSQCENTFKSTKSRFIERNKTLCYKCSIQNRIESYDYIKNYIEVESKSNCKLISDKYTGVLQILKVQCYCGNIFNVSFNRFFNGDQRRCKSHSSSLYEVKIENILKEKHIKYESQYSFDDCISVKNRKLKFDFAIFKNGNLQFLIEYDGPQHEESIKFFGGDEGLKKRKTNDNTKNDYCEKNNISLFRIKNAKKNEIENIVNKLIKEVA